MDLRELIFGPQGLYLLSGVFLFFGFITRSMLKLRILIAISGLLGAVYGLAIDQTIYMLGQLGLMGLNLLQILLLELNRRPVPLPPDLEPIYERSFTSMSRKEFLHFLALGTRVAEDAATLCKEGEAAVRLCFIIRGQADVTDGDTVLGQIGEGAFAGEMSFLSGAPYSADVVGAGVVDYVSWSHDQLSKMQEKEPQLYIKMLSILGVDVIKKMKTQRATIERLSVSPA